MGELAALSSSLCWAVASLLFAKLGQGIGPLALNLAKNAIALVLLVATLWALTGVPLVAGLSHDALGWLVLSGLIGLALGDTLYFAALRRLGAARTLILSALTPPMAALLAYPTLDEALGGAMIGGMAITLGGVVWVVRERSQGGPTTLDVLGVALGTGAALCQAAAMVLIKLGGEGHDALSIAVIRLAAGTAGLIVVIGLRSVFAPKALGSSTPSKDSEAVQGQRERALFTPRTARALFFATFIGSYLGIWLQVAGLTGAKAGIAATLSSTAPIFVLPLSAIFLHETLTARAIAGALVALGGIAVLFLF